MSEPQEQQEEGMVRNLGDAIDAMKEQAVKDEEVQGKGPPVVIAFLVMWPDGTFKHMRGGPASHPGIYLQMLGAAGVDAAREMMVPVGEEPAADAEQRIIVPQQGSLLLPN
jgi:hypothetical protein